MADSDTLRHVERAARAMSELERDGALIDAALAAALVRVGHARARARLTVPPAPRVAVTGAGGARADAR